ncbi:LysR family transcriptional regulator [Xinfangfangia sp. CPCC 101601]|uniref:LysR family transcriptional regulator n=1 Tax=Pseudogemmobacter lacusdianii TaxID=3069608 RepID=A0ABU0VZL3_9RHOB|nr:LysR family transcriptional regulator [Xinfangfangia sp. CPCC 101601]MDQ2067073.1 LysR family transcriptional regulator [Xinfangfangia sp. CPCC 101601]
MRRLQDVDLKLLRSFRSIVEAGGLVGAQAVLNVSQSTLSSQLADLEKRLDMRLCQRGRGGFALTEQGRQLLAALDDLLAAADQFQNATASIVGQMRGVLRLGLVDAILTNPLWDLPQILRRFNQRAPATVIELSTHNATEMQRLVLERKLDFSIGPAFQPVAGLEERPLFRERHALFCAEDHPLAGLALVDTDTLQDYPFAARSYLHRYDIGRIGQLSPAALVDSMETQALMIRSGAFIGFLPCHYALGLPGLARIRVMPGIDYLSPIKLRYRQDNARNMMVRSFLKRVAEQPLRTPRPGERDVILPFD